MEIWGMAFELTWEISFRIWWWEYHVYFLLGCKRCDQSAPYLGIHRLDGVDLLRRSPRGRCTGALRASVEFNSLQIRSHTIFFRYCLRSQVLLNSNWVI